MKLTKNMSNLILDLKKEIIHKKYKKEIIKKQMEGMRVLITEISIQP
jgi:hypothetical protein